MLLCHISGGLDSAVALAQTVKSGMPTMGVHFYLGTDEHIIAASAIADHYSVNLETIDLTAFWDLLRDDKNKFRVHGYRSIIDQISLAYAEKIGATHIVSGEMDWEYGNGDLDKQFGKLMGKNTLEAYREIMEKQTALYNEMYKTDIWFAYPLIHLTKASTVKLGQELNVPFELTHSCQYADPHCGTCIFCKARKWAFKEAGVVDKTEYADVHSN